jgi:hypothetical protein
MERCSECGGRLDRPGLYRCDDVRHPAPDLARRIAAAIERDASGRRGMRWDAVGDDVRDEIRDRWAELVRRELEA